MDREVAAIAGPIEEGIGNHGDEGFPGNAFGIDPEVVISPGGFMAGHADLKNVGVINGPGVALWELQNDATLLAEIGDGRILKGPFIDHFPELVMRL